MSSEGGPERSKRMQTVQSVFSRFSGASASMRSRGSSMLSKFQRDMMGFQENDTFRCREWLLMFTELLLAFSWNCFIAREKSEKTMGMRGITPREDTMETLFWLGFASLGNIIVGQLMDSLTGFYLMALINVILHFSLASLFLIGEIVNETSSEDVYAHLLSHVYLWSVPPIKALGFARYLYAMDQSAGKGAAFIINYSFLYNLFSLVGNFLFTVSNDTARSSALLAAVAFCFNGTVLFIFAYLLRPRARMSSTAPPREAALKVWGVLFTALRNKKKFGKKIVRQDWLEFAENKYDKGQIVRSRRLFRVFLMASPAAGFLLFTYNREVIFKEFYDNLKLSGPGVPKYLKWIVSTTSLLVVICIEYVLLPLLRACKYKINFLKRFLLGYISLVIAVIIAGVVSSITEKLPIRRNIGTLRVYNTMTQGNVTLDSRQEDFTQLRFIVLGKETVAVNFQASEQILFRMAVTFITHNIGDDTIGNITSYTQMFSVAPEEVLQYAAIGPASIIRVPGYLPIKQGPPGKNDRWKPRCVMVSLIPDRKQSVSFINVATDKRLSVDIDPGKIEVLQVDEGEYQLQYGSSISHQATAMFAAGGLYGIYLFLGMSKYEIDVDTILPSNTNHAMIGLLVSIPMMIARGIGQVALDAFVYTAAPEGLKGVAFGFYRWCAHSTSWFILIGFLTWHHYITPNIIVYYAVIAVVSFLLCLVLLLKYRHHYTI